MIKEIQVIKKVYICDYCKKEFKQSGAYKQHTSHCTKPKRTHVFEKDKKDTKMSKEKMVEDWT